MAAGERQASLGSIEPPAAASASRSRKLGQLIMRGSVAEMAGYGVSQVLRLAGNIILSRLLFPEAFGLLALVNVFNQGLVMLSDVGIEPAVIQSPRGDDRDFLNTAWTIHVLRGFILYAVALLFAWPLSRFYGEPLLAPLIAVCSLAVLINGVASTSLITLRRRLSLGKLAMIEIGSQAASVAVMVAWAYVHRSVWALAGGALASAVVRSLVSHLIDVGYHNRLRSEAAARSAIFHFGKWILASSAVFFASKQGDRILLGRFLGMLDLGLYSIALNLSESVGTAIYRLTSGVLYPAFSRVQGEGSARLREVYYRTRLVLDAVTQPFLGVLTLLGPSVVHLLYDKRYAAAGWMLQAFAVRVAMGGVLTPCESCLLSLGKTRYLLYENIARSVWVAVAIPLGWHFFGLRGLVYAAALSELPVFFVLWLPFHRAGILRLRLELRAAGFFTVGLGIGVALARVLPGALVR